MSDFNLSREINNLLAGATHDYTENDWNKLRKNAIEAVRAQSSGAAILAQTLSANLHEAGEIKMDHNELMSVFDSFSGIFGSIESLVTLAQHAEEADGGKVGGQ